MSSKGRGIWFLVSICLLIVIVINASLTIYYYQAYTDKEKQYTEIIAKLEEVSYSVNILIKYNNENKIWYNQTLIPIGWPLFNATLKATNGDVKYSIFFGSPFITEINNVKATGTFSWLWYVWDSTSSTWKSGETGADGYILKNQDIVAWYLADTSQYPNIPTP